MPIVRFSGLENEKRSTILKMMIEIKDWGASVEALDIGPEHVRPIYLPIIQEIPGECVIFEILELFTKSFKGTIRRSDMRKNLCQAIEKGFNQFVATEKFNTKPKKCFVIIRMVDRDKREFHHWDIPTSSPDDNHNFRDGQGSHDPNH